MPLRGSSGRRGRIGQNDVFRHRERPVVIRRVDPPAPQPRTPMRIVQILEQLARLREPVGLAELARQIGAPKTSVFSLLKALEVGGYVRQRSELYELGAQALRLGVLLEGSMTFTQAMRPILEKLATLTGETVVLAMLDEDRLEALYVDDVASTQAVRYVSSRGTRRPLYCTAAGKAILAFQSPEFIERYLSVTPLVKHASNTIIGKTRLRADLARIREQGYVRTYKEMQESVKGVAAPVMDADGRAMMSITVAMPADRNIVSETRLVQWLLEAASTASRLRR